MLVIRNLHKLPRVNPKGKISSALKDVCDRTPCSTTRLRVPIRSGSSKLFEVLDRRKILADYGVEEVDVDRDSESVTLHFNGSHCGFFLGEECGIGSTSNFFPPMCMEFPFVRVMVGEKPVTVLSDIDPELLALRDEEGIRYITLDEIKTNQRLLRILMAHAKRISGRNLHSIPHFEVILRSMATLDPEGKAIFFIGSVPEITLEDGNKHAGFLILD